VVKSFSYSGQNQILRIVFEFDESSWFFSILFLIYTIISNNYIILICLIDSLIEYDLKRNTEIEKCEGNVVNGTLGMKRDANLQSLEFFHSYEDIKEVLFGC
jgi:hypothetical protein